MREKKMSRFSTIAWGTFVILSLCLLYFPSALTARAAEAVEYISDPLTGETKTITESDYVEVTSDMVSWTDDNENGYYVVKSNATVGGEEEDSITINSRIEINGDIHLILEDGCTLNATQGIHVPAGSSLTIYGQERGTGTLDARTKDYYNAAIGGNKRENVGNITINGGTVTAISKDYGAGIGGGYNGVIEGSISINGGEVTATSRVDGAGIGSGDEGIMGGSISINGGEVTATSNSGAGIGSGWRGDMTGTIEINRGEVTATSKVDGAGIGSGYYGTMPGNIFIRGGKVEAVGGRGAGIGGDGKSFGAIQLTGGNIEASSPQGTAIGYTLNEVSEGAEEGSSTIIINGEVSVFTSRGEIRGNITIEQNGTLQIPRNKELLLQTETQLLNNGTIVNDGTMTNNGAMTNSGVFYNLDTFIDNGTYTGNEPLSYLIDELNVNSSQAEAMPGEQIELYTNMTARGQIPEIEWTVANAAAADTKLTSGEDGTAVLEIGREETAETLIVTVFCGNVSASAVVTVQSTPPGSDNETTDTKANTTTLNRSITLAWKNKSNGLRIRWAQILEADGYDIFVAQSKKVSFGSTPAATVTGGDSTTAVIKRVNGKKLKMKNSYKVRVRAYRMVNGEKQYIGSSMAFHVAGKKSTYTNAKRIRLAKKTVTLKKGRQKKIQATIVKQKKNKTLLPQTYVANLRYESSNKKIASVTKNGKIRAKKRGTCTIYVTAANGMRTQVKVKVK